MIPVVMITTEIKMEDGPGELCTYVDTTTSLASSYDVIKTTGERLGLDEFRTRSTTSVQKEAR
jgi:hypothetical protein